MAPTYTTKIATQKADGKEICSARSWRTARSPVTSSAPSSSSTLHRRVSSGVAAPEPLLCPDVNKRGDKTTSQWLFSWHLQVSSLFQPFRKVLLLSSSSPASSPADPRTPLCSSPGLSVGAAMHTISTRRSHRRSPQHIVQNAKPTHPAACMVRDE